MTQKSYIQLENYMKGPAEYLYCGVDIPYKRNRFLPGLELKDGKQWLPCI